MIVFCMYWIPKNLINLLPPLPLCTVQLIQNSNSTKICCNNLLPAKVFAFEKSALSSCISAYPTYNILTRLLRKFTFLIVKSQGHLGTYKQLSKLTKLENCPHLLKYGHRKHPQFPAVVHCNASIKVVLK